MQDRPELTFPEDVAALVRSSYCSAGAILEYGSGGSTILAAEIPNLTCFSVESDKQWAIGVQTWVDTNVEAHGVVIHYSNVGETREWGWPKQIRKTMLPKYARYPRSVWSREDFVHPDIVLIDGRFRVGCFLACITRIDRPTKILFDDYIDRECYHVVEELFKPNRLVGRMAEFMVTPRPLTLKERLKYMKIGLHPL